MTMHLKLCKTHPRFLKWAAICLAIISASLIAGGCKKEDRSEISGRTAKLAGTRTWHWSSETMVWGVFSAEDRDDTAFAIELIGEESVRVWGLSLSYSYSTDSLLIYKNETDQSQILGTLSYNYKNDSIFFARSYQNKANYSKDLFRCSR